MGRIFKDDLLDEFGNWPVAYIPYGGADFGEIQAVADAVGEGGDDEYYAAWVAAADRLEAEASEALAQGHRSSARDLYLRASCFYATSYHPLYGLPVDPRLVTAFRQLTGAFDRGLALFDPPVEQQRIPFGDTTLPAYLVRAVGHENEVRPLVVFTNGYDATITDMYFASAVAASRRGYHCLLFDGPGQGEMLIERGMPLRPDWETVANAVVEFALAQSVVDPTRIALSGWSLGGYLAPRAASGEPRFAACIADPGLWGLAAGLRKLAIGMGLPAASVANLGEIDSAVLDRLWQVVSNDRKLHWSIVRRGFWVNGARDFRDFLRLAESYTMDGRAERIACPTLITSAENDPLSASAGMLFDALRSPKTFLPFAAAQGAGSHCEMQNRSLYNRKALDWLDGIFDLTQR